MIKKIVRQTKSYKAYLNNGYYLYFEKLIQLIDFIALSTNNEKRYVRKVLGDSKPYNYVSWEQVK